MRHLLFDFILLGSLVTETLHENNFNDKEKVIRNPIITLYATFCKDSELNDQFDENIFYHDENIMQKPPKKNYSSSDTFFIKPEPTGPCPRYFGPFSSPRHFNILNDESKQNPFRTVDSILIPDFDNRTHSLCSTSGENLAFSNRPNTKSILYSMKLPPDNYKMCNQYKFIKPFTKPNNILENNIESDIYSNFEQKYNKFNNNKRKYFNMQDQPKNFNYTPERIHINNNKGYKYKNTTEDMFEENEKNYPKANTKYLFSSEKCDDNIKGSKLNKFPDFLYYSRNSPTKYLGKKGQEMNCSEYEVYEEPPATTEWDIYRNNESQNLIYLPYTKFKMDINPQRPSNFYVSTPKYFLYPENNNLMKERRIIPTEKYTIISILGNNKEQSKGNNRTEIRFRTDSEEQSVSNNRKNTSLRNSENSGQEAFLFMKDKPHSRNESTLAVYSNKNSIKDFKIERPLNSLIEPQISSNMNVINTREKRSSRFNKSKSQLKKEYNHSSEKKANILKLMGLLKDIRNVERRHTKVSEGSESAEDYSLKFQTLHKDLVDLQNCLLTQAKSDPKVTDEGDKNLTLQIRVVVDVLNNGTNPKPRPQETEEETLTKREAHNNVRKKINTIPDQKEDLNNGNIEIIPALFDHDSPLVEENESRVFQDFYHNGTQPGFTISKGNNLLSSSLAAPAAKRDEPAMQILLKNLTFLVDSLIESYKKKSNDEETADRYDANIKNKRSIKKKINSQQENYLFNQFPIISATLSPVDLVNMQFHSTSNESEDLVSKLVTIHSVEDVYPNDGDRKIMIQKNRTWCKVNYKQNFNKIGPSAVPVGAHSKLPAENNNFNALKLNSFGQEAEKRYFRNILKPNYLATENFQKKDYSKENIKTEQNNERKIFLWHPVKQKINFAQKSKELDFNQPENLKNYKLFNQAITESNVFHDKMHQKIAEVDKNNSKILLSRELYYNKNIYKRKNNQDYTAEPTGRTFLGITVDWCCASVGTREEPQKEDDHCTSTSTLTTTPSCVPKKKIKTKLKNFFKQNNFINEELLNIPCKINFMRESSEHEERVNHIPVRKHCLRKFGYKKYTPSWLLATNIIMSNKVNKPLSSNIHKTMKTEAEITSEIFLDNTNMYKSDCISFTTSGESIHNNKIEDITDKYVLKREKQLNTKKLAKKERQGTKTKCTPFHFTGLCETRSAESANNKKDSTTCADVKNEKSTTKTTCGEDNKKSKNTTKRSDSNKKNRQGTKTKCTPFHFTGLCETRRGGHADDRKSSTCADSKSEKTTCAEIKNEKCTTKTKCENNKTEKCTTKTICTVDKNEKCAATKRSDSYKKSKQGTKTKCTPFHFTGLCETRRGGRADERRRSTCAEEKTTTCLGLKSNKRGKDITHITHEAYTRKRKTTKNKKYCKECQEYCGLQKSPNLSKTKTEPNRGKLKPEAPRHTEHNKSDSERSRHKGDLEHYHGKEETGRKRKSGLERCCDCSCSYVEGGSMYSTKKGLKTLFSHTKKSSAEHDTRFTTHKRKGFRCHHNVKNHTLMKEHRMSKNDSIRANIPKHYQLSQQKLEEKEDEYLDEDGEEDGEAEDIATTKKTSLHSMRLKWKNNMQKYLINPMIFKSNKKNNK